MMKKTWVLLATLFIGLGTATANEVDEDRLRALSEELRCLVCQNQSIADSQAPLAEDLRNEARRLMAEGRSDDEIREWMVARYGDFVLYRPPFNPRTWALWLGPLVLLLLGGAFIALWMRAQNRPVAPVKLDEDRLRAALAEDEKS